MSCGLRVRWKQAITNHTDMGPCCSHFCPRSSVYSMGFRGESAQTNLDNINITNNEGLRKPKIKEEAVLFLAGCGGEWPWALSGDLCLPFWQCTVCAGHLLHTDLDAFGSGLGSSSAYFPHQRHSLPNSRCCPWGQVHMPSDPHFPLTVDAFKQASPYSSPDCQPVLEDDNSRKFQTVFHLPLMRILPEKHTM